MGKFKWFTYLHKICNLTTRHLLLAIVTLLFLFSSGITSAQYKKIYDFGLSNVSKSYSDITVVGSTFYGTTSAGGNNDCGVIFKINPDGSGFNIIHHFDSINGRKPCSVLFFNNYLYGTTSNGGVIDSGVLYKIKTDGSDFQKLVDFNGVEKGRDADGSLIVVNDTLYGRTGRGGSHNKGVIYKIKTDGSGFKKMLDFNGINGSSPGSSLVLFDNLLYGFTIRGGDKDSGVIFSIDKNGNNYKKILEFGSSEYGFFPLGAPLIINNTIYGKNRNDIFKVGTDGTSFKKLHLSNWSIQDRSFIIIDENLYGFNMDTLISVDTSLNKYKTLHKFNKELGLNPMCTPVYYNNSIIGTTIIGGLNNSGVIFDFLVKIFTPSLQASGINFERIAKNECTINWKRGDGRKCAVFIKQTNTGSAIPKDSVTYDTSKIFGSGSQIGTTGWYCVYNGMDSTVKVTGLSANTDYIVMVVEYNGMDGVQKYNITTASDNPKQLQTNNLNAQTIIFPVLNDKKYGDLDFDPMATATSMLPVSYSSSDTNIAKIKNGKINILNAGKVFITASQLGNATNFTDAMPVVQSLTINKASLTVKADDKYRLFTESNPVFTMTFSGFVNSDDISDLDSLPKIFCNVQDSAGNFPISLSGGYDNNYYFIFENGILTVYSVGIILNKDNVVLYPNPAGSSVTLEISDPPAKISIIDEMGVLVFYNYAFDKTNIINLKSLASGMYYVKVQSNSTCQFLKLIIE